jgi:hypothetical protein
MWCVLKLTTLQIEEDMIKAQQAAYSVAGVDETVSIRSLLC